LSPESSRCDLNIVAVDRHDGVAFGIECDGTDRRPLAGFAAPAARRTGASDLIALGKSNPNAYIESFNGLPDD